MSSRDLNKVQLIGNLTKDPELRYTPQGTSVCTLVVATNRDWNEASGEKREEVEFHRVVAWNKLAELCNELLKKSTKVYIEGRISSRKYKTEEGQEKFITEIVASDMLILSAKGKETEE